MMNKEKEMLEIYRNLLDGMPLERLVDEMSACMQRSLVLSDLSFRVLAYSRTFPVTDVIWKVNVDRGFCTYEFMEEIQKLVPDLFQKKTAETFVVNCDASEENKLVCPIVYHEQIIAYLLMLDNGKGIPEDACEMMAHFSAMATFSLEQMPEFQRLFGDMAENILDELMQTGDAVRAEGRFRAAGIGLELPVYCLSCEITEVSAFNRKYTKRTLRQMFEGSLISSYEDRVACYVSAAEFERTKPNAFEPLKKGTRCIGVSPRLSGVDEFLRGYQLARQTCRIRDLLQQSADSHFAGPCFIRKYEDYKFYNLLLSCGDREILRDNVHPVLYLLQEYDIRHNSALLGTLRSYLDHGRSIADTAEAMYIHRNTISYRLERIRELTGTDFEQQQECFELECSFRIYDLLQAVQPAAVS